MSSIGGYYRAEPALTVEIGGSQAFQAECDVTEADAGWLLFRFDDSCGEKVDSI